MNTAVVRAGIVNVPVLPWNFEVHTTGSLRQRLHGMKKQRLSPEPGIGERLRLRRGIRGPPPGSGEAGAAGVRDALDDQSRDLSGPTL